MQVVRVWPGKTFGGIYLAHYESGSTLAYSELIVFSALVRAGGKIGGWVSRIYVDSAESLAGGREIWGLPKELAVFKWDRERITVLQGETTLASANSKSGNTSFPIRANLPAFGFKNGQVLHFSGSCRGRISRARAHWNIPPESPLSELGLGLGWAFHLSEIDVSVPAPQHIILRS